MNKRRFVAEMLLVFLVSILLANTVFANAAEPPNITVLIPNAPDDINVTIRFSDGSVMKTEMRTSGKLVRGWETYFRFWFLDFDSLDFDNAVICVSSTEYNMEFAMPSDNLKLYKNLLTINLDESVVRAGSYPGRYAVIVAIRVISTLIMEGVVFMLFRYFEKRSWICFLVVNLITQAFVNITLAGADFDSYVLLGYVFAEIFVFIAESAVFPLLLRENGKGRAIVYAIAANTVSLIGGGMMLAHMPV